MYASIHIPNFPALPAVASRHAALLDCAGAFSPRVEDTAAHTVIIDVEGLDRLFGSAEELAQQLNQQLSELGFNANIAVASNPDAAECASRGYPGITIIDAGTETSRLQDLHIELLPLNPKMATEALDTLRRWGIHSFGDLARLPAKSLAARLGPHGVHLHRLACGHATRTLVPHQPALHFEESRDLDDAIIVMEPLNFLIHRLCDTLFLRLQFRGLAALEMHLRLLRERPHEPFVLSLRLPVPTRNPRVVARLFALELEAHPPGAPVVGIRLEATPSKPRVIQNGLFVPRYPEPEKLGLTLARIAGVVGRGNVGSPELQDTHARDRFVMTHVNASKLSALSTPSSAGALRLLRPAPEATVRLRNAIPTWIAFSLAHGSIETASGPWNSSGDWWNGQSWAREEWDVVLHNMVLRMYRNTMTGRWYAEGIYD